MGTRIVSHVNTVNGTVLKTQHSVWNIVDIQCYLVFIIIILLAKPRIGGVILM